MSDPGFELGQSVAEPTIGERGISFIRRAVGEAFTDQCLEVSEVATGIEGVTSGVPGGQTLNQPALRLLSGAESMKKIGLSHIPANTAVTHVLKSVPELLLPQEGDEGLVFNIIRVLRNRAGYRIIQLYVGDDSRPRQEREGIQDALNGLVPDTTIQWGRRIPEITLVEAEPFVTRKEFDPVERRVRSLMPFRADMQAVHPSPDPNATEE